MKTLSLLLLFAVSLTTAQAQQFGINASIFNAKGEFNNNINRNPGGISLNYLHNIGNRFRLGGEMGVAMYSNKTYLLDSGPYQGTTVYEEDCFWTFHALGQFVLYQTPTVDLYAEGRVGLTTFFSSKDAGDEFSEYPSEFKTHGTAFNTGIGGGIKTNLSGIFKVDSKRYRAVWLDFATTINSGTKAHYRSATENTKNLEDASYETFTNYVNYRIGIIFNLGKQRFGEVEED